MERQKLLLGARCAGIFLEGNPDRPLITGRVYHGLNMPPYALPEHKTRTVFKSMSTPGVAGKKRGFNELRVEDKLGVEEVYVHAEKDVNIHVKNDWKEHILHDRHETTDNFTYLETKGETHETLRGMRRTELFANDNRSVHADSHLAVDGKWLVQSGDEAHLASGIKIVLEAGAELTVKAGGQWIRLDPSGIRTSAPLTIGQGPPGLGTGASPLLPEGGMETEAGEAPSASLHCLAHASRQGACVCTICAQHTTGPAAA